MGFNISILGGGSAYTPGLVDGLLKFGGELPVDRLALMDVDSEKLSAVHPLVARMVREQQPEARVEATGDRARALEGADFVLCQIRVGGLAARHLDEAIPLRYGVIGQETTGPGGMAMALRTIPVMVDIARDMERIAPRAWLINYTNPTAMVAQAVTRLTGARMLSICDVPIGIWELVSRLMGVPRQSLEFGYAGLNHLGWVRYIRHQGQDILPNLRAFAGALDPHSLPPELAGALSEADDKTRGEVVNMLRLFVHRGAIPSPYLQYFYFQDELLAKQRAASRTRAQEVMALEAELLPHFKAAAASGSLTGVWDKRGASWHSELMVAVVAAIAHDKDEVHVVNVPNHGLIPGLGEDKIVEVPAAIGATGAKPLPVEPLDPDMLGLMQVVGAYEELTVQAALAGDRNKAVRALAIHPLVPSWDVASAIVSDYLEAHRAYLPQF
ncbi:MAG: 6-phospho-beta-glucosidase [Bacillota bacterium]